MRNRVRFARFERLSPVLHICLLAISAAPLGCDLKKARNPLRFETRCIAITSNELSFYPIAGVATTNDSTHFFGFDHLRRDKMDVFNLTSKKYSRSIHLESEGPSMISNVETFGFLNSKLLLKENFRLVLFDSAGMQALSLRKGGEVVPKNGFDFDEFSVIASLFDGLPSDSRGRIFLPIIAKQLDFPFAVVNWNEKTISLLGFKSPLTDGIEKYGDKIYPSIDIINDQTAVINYNFSSKIYLYDLRNSKVTEENIESDFTPNDTPPLASKELTDVSARVNYHLNELNFFGVRFDRFRHVFLRVHQAKREPEAPAVFYFTIISADFEKLNEIRLPNGVKPYFEVAPEGVYFPLEPNNESEICFYLLPLNQCE